jgi:hypothetical protein
VIAIKHPSDAGVPNCRSTAAASVVPALVLALALFVGGAGCKPNGTATATSDSAPASGPGSVQGPAIRALNLSNRVTPSSNPLAVSPDAGSSSISETVTAGRLQLGFGRLSSFPYRVYEYYAEGVSGRPLLKSDDAIPASVKALDGRLVTVRGFVLPLRTRQGRVTEFLLLRDQGTCCFGPQAQINHFIRVTYRRGREFETGLSYQVDGRLKVGETYVQGYLTGIYQMEAESVEDAPPAP